MTFLKKWKIPFFKKESQEGPPDFEEILRKIRAHFTKNNSKIFKTSISNNPSSPQKAGKLTSFFVIGLVVLVWFLSGIFIVSPAEQSAILYFGKYVKTVGPGPHWIPRLIASRYTINVQQIAMFPYQAEMLTKDENIVSVDVAVQYRIDNIQHYLFNVVNAPESLQQATASALRQVVGQTTLDEILTTGRGQVRDQVSEQIKKILALYQAGLLVTDVTLQPAKPPEQVTEAFDDAIKAREDEQRYINQAQAYAKGMMATAEGQVSRITQEAQAQKQKSILLAEGETATFLELLPHYQRTPQIMSKRMYLETMGFILSRSSKLLMETKSSNQMFYVPLDKLIPSEPVKAEMKSMKPSRLEPSQPKTEEGLLPPSRFQLRADYDVEKGASHVNSE